MKKLVLFLVMILLVGSLGFGVIEGEAEGAMSCVDNTYCSVDYICEENVCVRVSAPVEEQPEQPEEAPVEEVQPEEQQPTATSLWCNDATKCKNLDVVWKTIASGLNIGNKNSVWDGDGWKLFSKMYAISGGSGSGTGKEEVGLERSNDDATAETTTSETEEFALGDYEGVSEVGVDVTEEIKNVDEGNTCEKIRQEIANVAIEEWNNWNNGELEECNELAIPFLKNYRTAVGIGLENTRDKCAIFPWSAAFISYVIKGEENNQELTFPYSSGHFDYFTKIRDGSANQYNFKTLQKSDVDKINVGDIVCRCRSSSCDDPNRVDYDKEVYQNGDMAHCAIVVAMSTDGTKFRLIGGNEAKYPNWNRGITVKRTQYTKNDFLNSNRFFGFISPKICHT